MGVVRSYDDLSRKLWNLEGLPLAVTAVQGTHPALRYTDVSQALPGGGEEEEEEEEKRVSLGASAHWARLLPWQCFQGNSWGKQVWRGGSGGVL